MSWRHYLAGCVVISAVLALLFGKPADPAVSASQVVETSLLTEKAESSAIPAEHSPEITFDDMMAGDWVKPSDSDLRDWIRESDGSEASYLAAFSIRWSTGMTEWLETGLKVHPESLPMVLSAANAELLAISAGTGRSRKWLEKFRSLDPDNGLSWFLLALADFYEGDMERGSKNLIRAAEKPAVRFYSSRFEEASYEFGKFSGHSESVASLMGDAASPLLVIPKLPVTLREVRAYADILYESGFEREAEEIVIAAYMIGIRFFERDVSDNSWAIYPSIGISIKGLFEDRIPEEVLLASEAVDREMETFREQWKSVRGKNPGGYDPNESEYLEWNYFRRHFGETEAAVFYSR